MISCFSDESIYTNYVDRDQRTARTSAAKCRLHTLIINISDSALCQSSTTTTKTNVALPSPELVATTIYEGTAETSQDIITVSSEHVSDTFYVRIHTLKSRIARYSISIDI